MFWRGELLGSLLCEVEIAGPGGWKASILGGEDPQDPGQDSWKLKVRVVPLQG